MKQRFIRTTLIVFGGIVGFGILIVATTEITSRPAFCSICHYMRPYVEAWETSTHAEVTCTKCHFPPGIKSKIHGKFTALSMVMNYFTGVYKKSKPWAEISDTSCLRAGCHVERLLEGKVRFKEGIIFDHKPHIMEMRRGKRLRCTSCHSQIVQGEHISVTESTCFLCHFKNQPAEAAIDNCTWCHDAPLQTPAHPVSYDHSYVIDQRIDCKKCHGDMQIGDGIVPEERCSACHAEQEHINRYNDVEFIHKNHVTDHKVECQMCHLVIQHKSIARTGQIAPDCQTCHIESHRAQFDLFTGQGGKQIPAHPNPMFTGGLNCQGCHIFHESVNGFRIFGENVRANAESCESCHGQGYGQLLTQWQKVIKEKLALVEKTMNSTARELDRFRISRRVDTDTQNLFDDARYNFDLVKFGNPVHNVAYADELLTAAYRNLSRVLDRIQSGTHLPDLALYSVQVPSECKNCHYGQEEITVQAYGVQFSHNIHIMEQNLPCSKCHSNVSRHGETTITKQECLQCHHTQEIVSCEECHTRQASIFAGSGDFDPRPEPDPMYAAGITCRDCHAGDDSIVRKAGTETCITCHDEEYGQMLEEWQSETRRLMEDVATLLAGFKDRELPAETASQVADIEREFEQLRQDNSLGVHNIEFVTASLQKHRTALHEIKP